MGRLKIFDGPKLIYDEEFCCKSTGSIYSNGDSWVVGDGRLEWVDAFEYSFEIQEAVKDELSNHQVCCGGCI